MQEIERYEGFENAVTAIALDNQHYIATSSGVQMDNTVAGYAVRRFKGGKCVQRSCSHYGSIRCCSVCTKGNSIQ